MPPVSSTGREPSVTPATYRPKRGLENGSQSRRSRSPRLQAPPARRRRRRLRAGGAWSLGERDRRDWDPFSSPLFGLYVAGVTDGSRPVELTGGIQLRQKK